MGVIMGVIYEAKCFECGSTLDFRVTMDVHEDIFIDVHVCEKCLDDMETEQYDKGYDSGFKDGKEEEK